jgi:RNA polymerase sigma-70 factor (ECF subfamily)
MGAKTTAESDQYESFLAHYSLAQTQVQAFIRSLVHDRTAADDVYQATSLALWRKFPTFRADAEFLHWALGVARKEVLLYWRSRRRDRLVFSEAVLTQLADVALSVANNADPRQEALEACIEKLPERQRQLVSLFYGQQLPAETIAVSWNRTVHAVYKSLKVMRRNLMDCVDRTLAGNP